jgi:2,4-dienoyl-CoA reductase-like NADH-dependent reductase (Old Yellow Enzyme family)
MPPAGRPSLAQPLALRGHRLKNRLVVAPMCTNYAAPDGGVTRQLVDYYRARGAGGAGLVITEIAFIDALGSRGFQAQLGADRDRAIPGLGEIAEAIRDGGAMAGIQLGHCGSQRGLGEPPLVSASPIAWAPGKPVPKQLTIAEIGDVIAAFAQAARRAAAAGFDLIEVHGAHGYLVNAFLSPALNRRRDRYGGSAGNRRRFAIEVARNIRAAIGPDRLLSFRINGDDLLPGGLTIADYRIVARALVEAGVDLLHVSAGTYRAMVRRISPIYMAEAPFADLAGAIKKAVPVPVIASDTIHDPDLAERIVEQGVADLVSMARPNFADAELPGKILAGRDSAIIPCIRCNTCVAREQGGKRAYCAVNPATGREEDQAVPASRPRSILVIGGGPAGIECALGAARRGHAVTLAERASVLGGQIARAAELPFKAPLRRLCTYYDAALRDSTVALKLGVAVDAESRLIADHEVVVWATGPRWTKPSIVAAAAMPAIDPIEALGRLYPSGSRIVVIGATMIGAELAWHLALRGCGVTLIERGSNFAADVNLIYRIALTEHLAEAGVELRFGMEALAIEAGVVVARSSARRKEFPADSAVAAFGAGPRFLPEDLDANAAAVHLIGECAGQFGLLAATKAAYRLAKRL